MAARWRRVASGSNHLRVSLTRGCRDGLQPSVTFFRNYAIVISQSQILRDCTRSSYSAPEYLGTGARSSVVMNDRGRHLDLTGRVDLDASRSWRDEMVSTRLRPLLFNLPDRRASGLLCPHHASDLRHWQRVTGGCDGLAYAIVFTLFNSRSNVHHRGNRSLGVSRTRSRGLAVGSRYSTYQLFRLNRTRT